MIKEGPNQAHHYCENYFSIISVLDHKVRLRVLKFQTRFSRNSEMRLIIFCQNVLPLQKQEKSVWRNVKGKENKKKSILLSQLMVTFTLNNLLISKKSQLTTTQPF